MRVFKTIYLGKKGVRTTRAIASFYTIRRASQNNFALAKKSEDPKLGSSLFFLMFASNIDAKRGCHYGAGLSAPGGMR